MCVTAIKRIAKERQEQISKHGRTVYHDSKINDQEQLAKAAAYLIECDESDEDKLHGLYCPNGWDLLVWLKMCKKHQIERLIISAALLAAEIDRIEYTIDNLYSEVNTKGDEQKKG